MPDEDIEQFGKGAVIDPPDHRDFEASLGAVQVDFTQEFRLPEPPSFNQRSSDCCVACAWSYFMWQVFGKVYSKRDLFCRIALDYGAYIRDGGLALVKEGQADNTEVKDPITPTMSSMRDKAGTKPEYRMDGKVYSSFTLQQQDMDGIAWAIKEYKGVVMGVYGSNAGWKDKENPIPPTQYETKWGHALYLFGYHMHGTEKCIIAKSSWSGSSVHHIKATYFYSGNTFSAWTLIPKKDTNMARVIRKPDGTMLIEFGVTGKKVNLGINNLDFANQIIQSGEPVVEVSNSEGKQIGIIESGLIIDQE